MFDIESVSNINSCQECSATHGYYVPTNTPFLKNAYDLEYNILKKPAYFCYKCLDAFGFLRDIKPAIPKEVTVDKPKKKAKIGDTFVGKYANNQFFFPNEPGF